MIRLVSTHTHTHTHKVTKGGTRLPDFLDIKLRSPKECAPDTKTDRSIGHDRNPRNKPMNLWSIHLQQRRQEYII